MAPGSGVLWGTLGYCGVPMGHSGVERGVAGGTPGCPTVSRVPQEALEPRLFLENLGFGKWFSAQALSERYRVYVHATEALPAQIPGVIDECAGRSSFHGRAQGIGDRHLGQRVRRYQHVDSFGSCDDAFVPGHAHHRCQRE